MATPSQTFHTVKDVPAQDFIKAYAEFLKKNDKIKSPAVKFLNQWLEWVKTGKGKEIAPLNEDWIYVRAGFKL